MSVEKTLFIALPNEIILCIFEFLTTTDILSVFVQINQRYRDIVRNYVKHIDLTVNWQIYQSELQHLCRSIESAKVDRHGLDLFMNYIFPQLHSLILIRVDNWKELIDHLHLQNLKILLDSKDLNGPNRFLISKSFLTLKQFSSNGSFDPRHAHKNLTHLYVHISGVHQLLDMIEHIPNVQHISAHFYRAFDVYGRYSTDDKKHFEKATLAYPRLSNLKSITFTTLHGGCNENFPFYELQFFIDNCCSNKTILKKVTFQLFNISFNEDVWSIIQLYKNTVDSFNVYISFFLKNECQFTEITNTLLSSNQFAFHIEDCSKDMLSWGYCLYLHLYSLPFKFTKLYGYTCDSKLSQKCSYSTVRHLYFSSYTPNDITSFESLEKQMPNLVSIDYKPSSEHNCINNILPKYNDIFYTIHTLYYRVTCNTCDCFYLNQFSAIIDRMPNLKDLTTTIQTFNRLDHPLVYLKKLHLHGYDDKDSDKLLALVPNISILVLDGLSSNTDQVSLWVHSLFAGFSQLIRLSLKTYYHRWKNELLNEELTRETLAKIRSIDSKS